ncbi:IGEB protein, partial [Spelaeornis formosus]|nr:IGEB protein [Elachura formosa]
VKHITGIPHLSTGQALVEHANRIIKEYLCKQKTLTEEDRQNRPGKVLFTFNYLSLAADLEQSPIVNHNSSVKMQATPEILLKDKNPKTGLWEGP